MNADIWDQSVWCEEDFEWMKASIISLMEAAGEPVGTHDSSSVTVFELLKAFVVGTEHRKAWK